MKNLIIIYGPPRTASSFLLGALVQHRQCFGTDWFKDKKVGGTNENPQLKSPGVLDTLWKKFVPKGKRNCYLVLKAPGYCFAYPYFNNLKDYECKYIFVDRDPVEIADSMWSHEASQNVLKMNLESTDCPNKDAYRDSWLLTESLPKEAKIVNRALLRYDWHIKNIPSEMLEKSLTLVPYKMRKQGKEIAKKIETYLSIEPDRNMTIVLNDFYHRSLTTIRRKEIEKLILSEIEEMVF